MPNPGKVNSTHPAFTSSRFTKGSSHPSQPHTRKETQTMQNFTDINNINFSIVRERALRNIRKDLVAKWSDRFEAREIKDTFDSVVHAHRKAAAVEDYLPILVEAEMNNRLRDGQLSSANVA